MLIPWLLLFCHSAAAFPSHGPAFPVTGAAAAAAAAAAGPLYPDSDSATSIDGRGFPSLINASLEDLVAGLGAGLFTSVDLVDAYTARIAEVNGELHAVTELNPAARAAARALDRERACGKVRGPLHGIPLLLKDNIATDPALDGGMNTTAGSYALLGARVPADSTVAARLRRAGAVILGKANLSQWANFRSYRTSNGWSAYGGQVQGAYYPRQDPSGSSSGSGVSSSLGLALAALGTETSGSILSPSNMNNLVGIKPTSGLTSRYLVVPLSEHQDTVGPMARSVKDAAYILSAIAGPDPNDNYTSDFPFDRMPDYVGACKDTGGLAGKRIGIPRNLFAGATSAQRGVLIPAFDAALPLLEKAGATLVDDLVLPGADLIDGNTVSFLLEADLVSGLKRFLAKLATNPHNVTDLQSVRAFTQREPLEMWPKRDTGLWDEAVADPVIGEGGNQTPEFWGNYTRNRYLAGPLGVTGALRNNSLDALVLPTAFAAPLAAIVGAPVVTVPLGKYPASQTVVMNGFGNLVAEGPNLPFGISFVGERFSEEGLIGMAYAFEQRTRVRGTVEPYLKPETEVVDVIRGRKGIRS